jgi:short-subunit dehydrogenase
VALSETLYQELRLLNSSVGVSVLCPGGIKTRFLSSSRNRPLNLTLEPASPITHPPFLKMNEDARRLIEEQGMPPEQIAAMTIDAVKTDVFYVLPHREMYKEALQERLANILDGTPPSFVKVVTEEQPPPR